MTTTYFPGGAEGYKVLTDFPLYAISEAGVIRALANTDRTSYGAIIEQSNGRVFLYQFDEQGNWKHRIVERVSQLHHEAYSDGMGAGVRVPEKKKITIEIEDPELVVQILDHLVVRDYAPSYPSINQCYSWLEKTKAEIKEGMKGKDETHN